MSRLIVLNLPKHLTVERFRAHFEARGLVTDAKLMFTTDGKFRRFGFIGYKTDLEAATAQKYFDGTFIDTSKISVQMAKGVGNQDLSRPWSKYSKGSSAFTKTEVGKKEWLEKMEIEKQEKQIIHREAQSRDSARKNELLDALSMDKHDPKLKEYLQVMQPRSKTQTWANDEGTAEVGNSWSNEDTTAQLVTKNFFENGSDDDEAYEDLPNAKKIDSKSSIEQEVILNLPLTNLVARDEKISDLDYFKSKITIDINENEVEEDIEKEDIEEDDITRDVADRNKENETIYTPQEELNINVSADYEDPLRRFRVDSTAIYSHPIIQKEDELNTKNLKKEGSLDSIVDTGRLFVRNLAYSCSSEELEELFSKFGPISEIHISIDKETKISKGYAFILYLIPENAVRAYAELDGTVFQGRLLDIIPAQEKLASAEVIIDENSSFKTKRDAQKKAVSMQEFSWNSLFMNSDSVITAMADRLGVRKSDILNVEEGDLAVKLALAETQIINDTKEYLLGQGIDLNAFQVKKRSKCVIIVKNIPYHTEIEEIQDLFGKFGMLGRVLLPPTKTICIVEFVEETEAKVAFRQLAYTRFKSLPLYLEWSPENIFSSALEAKAKRSAEKVASTDEVTTITEEKIEEITGSTPTVYIKNLNFATTEPILKEAFFKLKGFQSARLATKPDPKNQTARLSMGFGFLEFKSREDAKQAMKIIQGTMLDGHVIQCKMSNGKQSKTQKTREKDDLPQSTKIMIRNIPFEATKREIRALFTPYGQIKAVRLPKKMDGTHRGFGFIHFLTKQEAKSAFDALCNTHFYGRHLVLEWAKEDESVDALREKTRREFDTDYAPKKKTKFSLIEEQEDTEM